MKKALKVTLIIIGILILLVGITAAYINFRSIPKYDVEKINVNIDHTPQRVAQGYKLASMLCKSCHYNNDTKKFTGRLLSEAPQFGKIFTANITHDSLAGIGKWSDADLVYFIRTGIKPNGQYVPPYMPKLIHISDEDLNSIVSFLRSDNEWLAADNMRHPESEPSFLTKFLVTIGAAKPFPYPTQTIAGPDTTNIVAHGKYIALYQMECFSCHSQDFAKNDYFTPEKSPGFFAGGNKMFTEDGKPIYSLNITKDKETGIGNWSEAEFVKAITSGVVPNGQPALHYPMIPYSNLTEHEAKAVYAYLQTVPAIKNKVNRMTE